MHCTSNFQMEIRSMYMILYNIFFYLEWCLTIAFLIVLLTEEFTDDESEADEFIDNPLFSRDNRIYL